MAYGTATIRLEGLQLSQETYFTYNTACAVLRGMPEYMTRNDWWVESLIHVYVDNLMAGTVILWNPGAEGTIETHFEA